MKRLILGTLVGTGLLLAQQHNWSWYQREALSSQSPRIHTKAKYHKHQEYVRSADRITVDKTTINAYVPYGK